MTSFQMQHLKNITEAEEIPLRYLVHYRGHNRNRVFEAIHMLYLRLAKEGKINQKKLAKRLGKNKAQINRWLSEPSNLTLDSISDLLLAMNAEIRDFETVFLGDRLVEAREQSDITTVESSAPTLDTGSLSGVAIPISAGVILEVEPSAGWTLEEAKGEVEGEPKSYSLPEGFKVAQTKAKVANY